MNTILRWIRNQYSGPFQATLVFAFTAVAALTIGVGTWVISSSINNYLAVAMDERVARDINLAKSYYDLRLREVAGAADRISSNPTIIKNMGAAGQGETLSLKSIQEEILREANGATLAGDLFVAILGPSGDLVCGHFISVDSGVLPFVAGGNWFELPVIQKVLVEGQAIASTEVIPVEYLEKINLAEQARIQLIDTPKTAAQLFDPREGSAGLVIIDVTPIVNPDHHILGAALAFHMFNNDFALVDQIKETAGIDTVTIFLGDMRVSTNVMNADNQRAVGTRLAKVVGDVVLFEGRPYVGTAFVVNENYITRYEPLRDNSGQVIGALYVGARQALFLRLLNAVDQRILLIAVLIILITFILATPVSRHITRPLKELRELVITSRLVADGDLSARAPVTAGGAVGKVASSFNRMLDTLQTTQEQLVHSEKLASLGQLAAGVAHELNNPLGTLLLYSDTLLRESAHDDPHRADLETIVRETQRCKTIVAALLDFARQNQVDAIELDLNLLIQKIIAIEQKHERYANIRIIKELDANLPRIQADPSQLMEVFVNLMSNAAEAMPTGGSLTLRTLVGPPGTIMAEVEDTGSGIAPENLSKLFTPFFTTKPIGKGTGLGLAISYGIIKMHRGQITVQSEVGKGTTFKLSLPIRLPNLEASFRPPSPTDGNLIG